MNHRSESPPESRTLDDPATGYERTGDDVPARGRTPRRELEREHFNALFGECRRSGDWSAPETASVNAWFGEVSLDFTEAELPHDGVVEVDASAVFGQVTLTVPRGTDVELQGTTAIFGEVSRKQTGRTGNFLRKWVLGDSEPDDGWDGAYDDEEPMLLRVTGLSVFGSVTVNEV